MADKNKHIIPYELVVKSITGDISDEEDQAFQKWVKSDPEHQLILEELKKSWDSLDLIADTNQIDIEAEWQIQLDRIASIKSIKSMGSDERSRFWTISKAAAIFVVFILAAIAIYYASPFLNINRTISSVSIETIDLPDGSVVSINANSTFKYPSKFKQDKREVYLKGEAFFEVAPNAQSPFIIHTENSTIKVLGTSFNIKSNPALTEVVVQSGTVSLSAKKNTSNVVILTTDEYGVHNSDKNLLTKKVNTNTNFLAWKTRKINFENELLVNVISVLESVYSQKIILKDTRLANCSITSSFENQSLNAILNVIGTTLDLEIIVDGDTFVIDGKGC